MISELKWFTMLFLAVLCMVWWLAESETLREHSDRRAINRLADRSRRRKAQTARRACQYARAGWRPGENG